MQREFPERALRNHQAVMVARASEHVPKRDRASAIHSVKNTAIHSVKHTASSVLRGVTGVLPRCRKQASRLYNGMARRLQHVHNTVRNGAFRLMRAVTGQRSPEMPLQFEHLARMSFRIPATEGQQHQPISRRSVRMQRGHGAAGPRRGRAQAPSSPSRGPVVSSCHVLTE